MSDYPTPEEVARARELLSPLEADGHTVVYTSGVACFLIDEHVYLMVKYLLALDDVVQDVLAHAYQSGVRRPA